VGEVVRRITRPFGGPESKKYCKESGIEVAMLTMRKTFENSGSSWKTKIKASPAAMNRRFSVYEENNQREYAF